MGLLRADPGASPVVNSDRWSLACSECAETCDVGGLPSVCRTCGAPWLVRYSQPLAPSVKADLATRSWSMWRYREWLPVGDEEDPVTLGEGMTPLLPLPLVARELGLHRVWIKDEAVNPTGSFKARGMSCAVTRARGGMASRLTAPTAGNAGVALSACGRRAAIPVFVFAPQTTPHRILEQIRRLGATLELSDGHIGDCGKAARAFAAEHGAFDVPTLREPYRIEGKKTLALEIAEQLDWELPDAIIYPTGGGTGIIGMWKAFTELRDRRLGGRQAPPPLLGPVDRMRSRGSGVRARKRPHRALAGPLHRGERPQGSGPDRGRLMLRALRESGGQARAVADAVLSEAADRMTQMAGIDAGPEGGATLAALEVLTEDGAIAAGESVAIFNTGAGWLYR